MRTKRTTVFAVGIALALGLAACGGGSDNAETDGGGTTPSASDTDQSSSTGGKSDTAGSSSSGSNTAGSAATGDAGGAGGELRYFQTTEPATMNPVKSTVGDANVWGSMFDRIAFIDEDLNPTGDGLVTKWEATDDTTWQFTLREGVQFHNGEPWNADAFKFTIEEYRDNPDGIMAGFLAGVTDVVVVDDYTVDVQNATANGAIPYLMATLYALPPAYYAEVGDAEFALKPLGTGPFVFADYQPGTSVSVTANPDYWRGAPKLAGIKFGWAVDEASRSALLEAGDADIVDSLSVRSVERVKSTDGLAVTTIESLRGMMLFLVDSKPPLDDPLLREAVARAIDPQAIVDSVFEGTGAYVMDGILAPINSYIEAPPSVYDPERSKEILASMDSVPPIPFHYQVGRQLGDGDVGEVIAGMLEEVGFTVERDPQEYATLIGSIVKGEVNGMFDTGTFPVYLHPDVFANAFMSPTVSITKSCLGATDLDDLRTQGVEALDPEAAGKIYSEMDFMATNEQFCVEPTYLENRSFGHTDKVQNFNPRRDSIIDWYEVSM